MRYLSPVSNPLAHYWEEDLSGIWGLWLRLRERASLAAFRLVGELLLANLYLLVIAVSELPLINHASAGLARLAAFVNPGAAAKRMIDIVGAVFGLAISLPLWIIIPVFIKLDSQGTVLYSQTRVGRNRRQRRRRLFVEPGAERRQRADRRQARSLGRPFTIYKFRTMFNDAEKISGPVWAKQDDPRITRMGLILRKTRCDEIPQLINVLLGDMSLVGPRPERPYFVEKLDGAIKDYRGRFLVKPGLTGLAQVEHKYDESIEDVNGKINYDLKYISNWSVFQDIKIMLKTVIVVIGARGM